VGTVIIIFHHDARNFRISVIDGAAEEKREANEENRYLLGGLFETASSI